MVTENRFRKVSLQMVAIRDGKWNTEMERVQTLAMIQTDLLEWGRLDPNAVSHNGTALDLACRRGDLRIIEALVRHGAHIDIEAVCAAAYQGNVEILKFLLAKGDNLTLDMQGQNGTTPLHDAIRGDSLEAIEYLLANGARHDIADDDGFTAEQCAEIHHINLSR